METENSITEYKSLQKITKGDNGLTDLARTCVCLANSQRRKIYRKYPLAKKNRNEKENEKEKSQIPDLQIQTHSLFFFHYPD